MQFIGAYPKKTAMIFEMTLTLHMLLWKVDEGGLLVLPHKESQHVKANCFLGYQFVGNMLQLKSVTPVVGCKAELFKGGDFGSGMGL